MTSVLSPLVIFALDAADARLIERWAEEGYLPTIAAMRKRGCWGRLTGTEFESEHGVWVSLLSGISRSKHGYYHWRPLRPGTYDLCLSDLREVRALPFWSGLREQSKNILVIDAPETYPIPGLSGIQLANWAPHNPRFPTCTEPAELLHTFRQRFGPQPQTEEKGNSSFAQDQQIYHGLCKQIDNKGEICRALLREAAYSLVVVGFSEAHIAGHQFWRYQAKGPSSLPTPVDNPLRHAIRDIYQAIDRQMGVLLERMPADTHVIVLSNVGLHEEYPTRKLTEAFCQRLGYQAASQSSRLPFHPRDLVRRLLPEPVRRVLNRSLSRNMREYSLADQFRTGTAWQKTTVFALPAFYTGFLRVNLRGREPQGVVESGLQYAAVLDQVESDLRQLYDPETHQPAVQQIVRTVERFGGEPPRTLPDLFFTWTPTSSLRRSVVHPKAILTQEHLDFVRETHHSPYGFVTAMGPLLKRGDLGNVRVLDIAPTCLTFLREPPSPEMTGRTIMDTQRG